MSNNLRQKYQQYSSIIDAIRYAAMSFNFLFKFSTAFPFVNLNLERIKQYASSTYTAKYLNWLKT